MNRLYIGHIITSVAIIFVQILLLKNVQLEIFGRFTLSIIIYPSAIIFLPIGFRRTALILIAFVLGLLIDMFYDSPGVHTAALVFTAFARAFVLRALEPRQGYRANIAPSPRAYGTNWFLSYLGILLFLHIFLYFSIDAFTYVYLVKILVNTLCSFIVSYILLILYKTVV